MIHPKKKNTKIQNKNLITKTNLQRRISQRVSGAPVALDFAWPGCLQICLPPGCEARDNVSLSQPSSRVCLLVLSACASPLLGWKFIKHTLANFTWSAVLMAKVYRYLDRVCCMLKGCLKNFNTFYSVPYYRGSQTLFDPGTSLNSQNFPTDPKVKKAV